MTHIRRLRDLDEPLARYYEAIGPWPSSSKLGPVLWQLPANFKRDEDRLADALERFPPGRHCFEFRHESWFTEDVFAILRAYGAALVFGDHPERPWQPLELTTDWTLIRFHYGAARPARQLLRDRAARVGVAAARRPRRRRGVRLLQQRLGGLRAPQRHPPARAPRPLKGANPLLLFSVRRGVEQSGSSSGS